MATPMQILSGGELFKWCMVPTKASSLAVHSEQSATERRCVWKGTPAVEQLQMPSVPLIYYNTHVEPESKASQVAPLSSKRARPMIDRSRERQ